MKSFSDAMLKDIFSDLENHAKTEDRPVAAFDADGTLWTVDMGELFFQWQINSGLLELPKDPWAHYENLKKEKSPQAAYLWLAQINAGKNINDVRAWSRASFESNQPIPTFEFQHQIIKKMHDLKFEVFIVTASIAWAVEPAASLYNIPAENVIGVKSRIVDGLVTEEQDGIITYKAGKSEALLERTQGKYPCFVSGNTEGDLSLLESSTASRLVVASAPEDDSNYETEQKMQALAKERNWYHYSALD